MPESYLASEFMKAAVGGVSKAQVIRTFREQYDLGHDEIQQIVDLCQFKRQPKQIDYLSFYNAPITEKAKQIYYPFTQLYTQENFLSEEECSTLTEIIDQNLRPSTVSDPQDACIVSDYRTSKTSDLHYFDNPFFLEIDKKISDFIGFSPFLGETMQAQRYEPGQYYKEHWDFFMPTSKEYQIYCEWMGQRTWTTMIYLNDVAEGGETFFKHLKLRIKPKRGLLIAWNNLYKNGLPNLKTMHEACPPTSSNKYVITKWWRSWSLI
jgi:prolyl 4-hydroxylase